MDQELNWFSAENGTEQLLLERGGQVDDETFALILKEVSALLTGHGVPHVFMGGLASAAYGRPRWTHDIDIFLSEADAKWTLSILADAGYETQETYPDWLYKAMKRDVLIDLIFRSKGDMHPDPELLDRAVSMQVLGQDLSLIPPEDLIVMKAMVHDEPTPRHWHDALGVIRHADLDWDYLLSRARHGPRRVLSLLLYAQSNDLLVPTRVIGELYREIFPEEQGNSDIG